MSNIWDVVKPLNMWERWYAHMEYLRGDLKKVGALKIPVVTKIEVKHVSV